MCYSNNSDTVVYGHKLKEKITDDFIDWESQSVMTGEFRAISLMVALLLLNPKWFEDVMVH